MTYSRRKQFTVDTLRNYLNAIPGEVKVCINWGDEIAPACFIENNNGHLVISADCYKAEPEEVNMETVLSFLSINKNP